LIPAEAIQDLLGFQTNLAAALIQMCNLAEGKAQVENAADTFVTLNKLLAAGKLPETQEMLFNRVHRELRSANPLSRNEPSQEFEAYLRILNRLITVSEVTGGPLMAEALTHRFVRNQQVGGQAGLQNAFEDLPFDLGGRCRGIIYLMNVVQAPRIAEKFKDLILRKLGYFTQEAGIDEWTPAKLPPPERMTALTNCFRAISQDKGLPEQLRADLANAADTVLVGYLEHSGIIEKIDKPEDPLAFRALRLVKFCGSGVLIKGKSLALAQKRILSHLRQPNFEEKFLSSIPDKSQAEKHLREFHKLLIESGFKF
jgi:hypothetical protein